MAVSIKATIDDLNKYLQDDLPAQDLVDTLEKLLNFLKDSEGISENKNMENLNEGKKSSYMTELAEIDKQSALVALEAKINKLAEMAEVKENRLALVNEDENLSELISKQAVKEMRRSIKEIEKLKEKLLKEFTKKGGKMTEVIDEEVEEGYGSTTYEEDGTTMEEEIDEASCGTYEEGDIGEGIEAELETNKGVTWDEAEPAQVAKEKLPTLNKEETNEEVSRWQELAGL